MRSNDSLPPSLLSVLNFMKAALVSIVLAIYDFYVRHFSSSGHSAYQRAATSENGSGSGSDPKNLNGRSVRLSKGSVTVDALLGEGGFAYVYLCRSGDTKYALKVSNMSGLEQARKERDVGMLMESPNVCGVIDFGNIQDQDNGMDVGSCYLLFPYLTLSLRDHLNRYTKPAPSPLLPVPNLSSPDIIRIFSGIVAAIQHMHSRGFAHMDVKVDNVMMKDGNAVIVDMGSAMRPLSSSVVSKSGAAKLADQAASNTTVIIRPPELFEGGLRNGDSFDAFKADVWGLGCMLYALNFGWSPFEVEYDRQGRGLRYVECSQLRVLGDSWDKYRGGGEVGERSEIWEREGWREICRKCLKQKQGERCAVDNILGAKGVETII
mmetsp:Transcript_10010/g.20440  ORF Transcript_10010/g.20440 Transcript_10010/m.20440 type:complete len:378 (-) Transcript_10010:11-1144(-)